jgi:quinolinate synthase
MKGGPNGGDSSDEVLGTGGMVRYARRDDVKELLIGTEIGIIRRLRKENPGKRFVPVSEQAICPDMKLVTLDKVLRCIEEMEPKVRVPNAIRGKASGAIDRMLAMSFPGAPETVG